MCLFSYIPLPFIQSYSLNTQYEYARKRNEILCCASVSCFVDFFFSRSERSEKRKKSSHQLCVWCVCTFVYVPFEQAGCFFSVALLLFCARVECDARHYTFWMSKRCYFATLNPDLFSVLKIFEHNNIDV